MSQSSDPFEGRDPNQPGSLTRPAAEQLIQSADELAGRGDFEQAVPYYRRVIGNGDAGLHVAAALGLADALYRLDDEEGALQWWVVAASAPETPLSWKAWKMLAAARVRQGDLVAAARAYREAERRAPAMERPEIASRLGWLNKEMGNDWQARRYFSRSRDLGDTSAILTYSIIAITVLIGLVTEFGPSAAGDPLVRLFLLDKERVAAGEWWRLVTVVLLHGGIVHLAFNMYALYLVGPIVEGLYGRVVVLGAYALTAAAGSTASFVLLPDANGVGASGAIFGLFGMLLVTNRVYRPVLGRQARALTSQIGMLIAINLVLGFGISGFGGIQIDNFAHIGGLIAGAWLGLVLPPRGAVTLRSFWQGLEGRRSQTVGAGAQPPGTGRSAGLAIVVRGAAVALLVLVLAVGVAFGSRGRVGRRGGLPSGDASVAIVSQAGIVVSQAGIVAAPALIVASDAWVVVAPRPRRQRARTAALRSRSRRSPKRSMIR